MRPKAPWKILWKQILPLQAIVKYEKVMIENYREQELYSMSWDRSVCPDKRYVDNLWTRLHLLQKGTMCGPEYFVQSDQWIKESNSKEKS